MGSNDHLEGSGMGQEPEQETGILDLVQSVAALSLESDELVVLYVPTVLTQDERAELHRGFQRACPNTRCMVVDGGVSLQSMSVAPDDKIVVRCPGALTQEERGQWECGLAAIFPENNCIVLEAGETVGVASEWIVCRRPDSDRCLVARLKGRAAVEFAECPDTGSAIMVMEALRARDETKGD